MFLKHHFENVQWVQESSCSLLTVAVSGSLCVFSQDNPAHTVSAGFPQYNKIQIQAKNKLHQFYSSLIKKKAEYKALQFKWLRITESLYLNAFSIYMGAKIRMSLEFNWNEARGRKEQLLLSG